MPEITLTLGELVNAEGALTRLMDVKMSAQLAYNIAKLAKAVQKETKHFHEQREALIREMGEPFPDDPQKMIVKPSEVATFTARINELAAVEATLTIQPLKLESLPEMTGADLLALGPLVTD